MMAALAAELEAWPVMASIEAWQIVARCRRTSRPTKYG